MRFIDAEKCPCLVGCYPDGSEVHPCVEPCEELREWFLTPAYDIDKVVEELEKYQELCFSTMANTQDPQLDIVCEYVTSAIKEAIDIVKGVG